VLHGGVDEVHPGDGGAERDHEAECAEIDGRPRAQDREQDDCGEPESQRHDPCGFQQIEGPLPQRLADLHAHHAAEHEQRGRRRGGHASTVRPRAVNV
jgi:hypothetical protein